MSLRQSKKLAAACAREARLATDPHCKAWFRRMAETWRLLAKNDAELLRAMARARTARVGHR